MSSESDGYAVPMGLEVAWIHSADETPKLGSGRRLVLAEVGRRWVKVWSVTDTEGHPDKLLRSVYEGIRVGEPE